MDDKQLQSRGFWKRVEHSELHNTITYPGAFAKLSETPIRLHRRAPLIAEHNEDIFVKELGISKEELTALRKEGVI